MLEERIFGLKITNSTFVELKLQRERNKKHVHEKDILVPEKQNLDN
jgi:hypothetical protein